MLSTGVSHAWVPDNAQEGQRSTINWYTLDRDIPASRRMSASNAPSILDRTAPPHEHRALLGRQRVGIDARPSARVDASHPAGRLAG